MKTLSVVSAAVACCVGMAWAADVAQTGPSTATRPAQTAPATATSPATTAAAKRTTPVTVTGKADPRAPGYILLFENNVDAKTEVARLEKAFAFKATHIYSMPGFQGFAATLSAEVVEKLRWELTVKSIEHDGSVSINNGGAMGPQ